MESGIWVQSSELYSNFCICTFIKQISKTYCVLTLIPPKRSDIRSHVLYSEDAQSIGRVENHRQNPVAQAHQVAASSFRIVKEYRNQGRQASWWTSRGHALEKARAATPGHFSRRSLFSHVDDFLKIIFIRERTVLLKRR